MGEHMNKAKGKIKQAAGTVAGDMNLKREGQRDEAKGRIEGAMKDGKNAAKELKKAFKPASK